MQSGYISQQFINIAIENIGVSSPAGRLTFEQFSLLMTRIDQVLYGENERIHEDEDKVGAEFEAESVLSSHKEEVGCTVLLAVLQLYYCFSNIMIIAVVVVAVTASGRCYWGLHDSVFF